MLRSPVACRSSYEIEQTVVRFAIRFVFRCGVRLSLMDIPREVNQDPQPINIEIFARTDPFVDCIITTAPTSGIVLQRWRSALVSLEHLKSNGVFIIAVLD